MLVADAPRSACGATVGGGERCTETGGDGGGWMKATASRSDGDDDEA